MQNHPVQALKITVAATEAAVDGQQYTTTYLKWCWLPISRSLNQGSASEAVAIKDQNGRAETEWAQIPKLCKHGHTVILWAAWFPCLTEETMRSRGKVQGLSAVVWFQPCAAWSWGCAVGSPLTGWRFGVCWGTCTGVRAGWTWLWLTKDGSCCPPAWAHCSHPLPRHCKPCLIQKLNLEMPLDYF